MRGIVKQFPGVRALDGVDLRGPGRRGALPARPERRRQVHADQGARRRPPARRGRGSPGSGEPVSLGHPVAALKPGIATIYQELDLVDGLSRRREHLPRPRDSPAAASPSAAAAHRARARAARRASATPRSRPTREVGPLSAAGKQIVSIARALSQRRPADRHGRAVGRARRRGGRATSSASSRDLTAARRGRRLHLAPARGDPPDRRPDHRAQGRPDRRHRASPARDDPDRRADHADDRPHHRVRLPAAAAGAADGAEPLLEVAGLACAGEFDDVSFDVRAGRDRRPRRPRRRPGAARSSRPCSAPGKRDRRHGRGRPASRCAPARSAPRSAPASGCAPRSASRQGLMLDEPVYRNITLVDLRPVRRAAASSTRRAERAAAARADPSRSTSGRPTRDRSRPHPVRRQPAEGPARALAAARLPGAAARRAHPRRRRRRPRARSTC